VRPYYEDGAVVIYHADCRDVLPELAPIPLILTDPPYGVGVQYGDGYDDSPKTYWPWFHGALAAMRTSARTVIFTHRVKALAELHDWDWVGVWSKPYAGGARIGNSPVLPNWEPIFMYGIHALGVHGQHSSDVFDVSPQKTGEPAGDIGRAKWTKANHDGHPCPKPHELYSRLVQAFTSVGDSVVDPFMGSGTTLRAAKDLGRRAIGIDIEERFCESAARRCAQEVLALEGAA
jgi:site-specific DNA-methyltransferase (adenine-specific)